MRRWDHEAYVPAESTEAEKSARVSEADEHEKRPKSVESPAEKGEKSAFGLRKEERPVQGLFLLWAWIPGPLFP